MSVALRILRKARLVLHNPPVEYLNVVHYSISGWPAVVQLWTPEEWARLDDPSRPAEARQAPNGYWVALRML